MILENLILSFFFSLIVLSFIWARYSFFRKESSRAHLISFINDPLVAVQIVFTYYGLLTEAALRTSVAIAGVLGYSLALSLFWWALNSVNRLNFASEGVTGEIIVTGAFSFVRHPLYLSYIVVWLTSSLILGHWALWISAILLFTMYFTVAKQEERLILESDLSTSYSSYKRRVGMFLPIKFNRRR